MICVGGVIALVLLALLEERREKAREDRLVKAFKVIYGALGLPVDEAKCRAGIRARRSARILRGRGA